MCPECYNNEIKFWRNQPMNEEIRKVLTYSRHANQYYLTLNDALEVWGNTDGTSDSTEIQEMEDV